MLDVAGQIAKKAKTEENAGVRILPPSTTTFKALRPIDYWQIFEILCPEAASLIKEILSENPGERGVVRKETTLQWVPEAVLFALAKQKKDYLPLQVVDSEKVSVQHYVLNAVDPSCCVPDAFCLAWQWLCQLSS